MTAATPGTARWCATVTDADTAHALGNPGIHVLATPRLADFCDRAAAGAAGRPSRHMRVDIRHLAATPAGDEIEISAELVETGEDRLVFAVSGRDSHRDIVTGRVVRLLA